MTATGAGEDDPGPGLRSRPLVLVADLGADLDDADRHHLERVLRLGRDDVVTVCDGVGNWAPARVGPPLTVLGPVRNQPRPVPALTVAFTPVKGTRPEWVVQKLTELGLDRIVPVFTERSVVRWDRGRADKLGARLDVTAREACQQCRRLHRPEVGAATSLERFLADPANAGVVLADPAGRPPRSGDRIVVVGPEGGFSAGELALADAVALPGAILRAETAAVVAGAVLVGLRSGLLTPAG